MNKKHIFGALWMFAVILAVYVFVDQKIIKNYATHSPAIEAVINVPDVNEINIEVITTPPLRATTTASILRNNITASQIISSTNQEREKVKLPALGDNTMLDKAALAKAKDMFLKQYFDSVSPSGETVENFTATSGYEYLIIGENIASGNFKSARAIVDAWMRSQKHKENILNSQYREMGAAVIFGIFEGKRTLFVVQIFGSPSSLCPKPSESYKSKIAGLNNVLTPKKQVLDMLYQKITSGTKDDIYAVRVAEYNVLAKEYNSDISQAKNLITVYNDQVLQFNNCAASLR